MTDYLELIFAAPGEKTAALSFSDAAGQPSAVPKTGETEGELSVSVLKMGEIEAQLSVPALKTEEPEAQRSAPASARGELFRQQETLRRLEEALEFPEFPAFSAEISRPEGEGYTEALERRLRRDSRRYDGGFYLY